MNRTIAIGDIHGCSEALAGLLAAIDPQSDDTIVPLGDYVDRGPDTKGVLDQLIAFQDRCQLVPILGNHDQLMLDARGSESDFESWMDSKGATALASYGTSHSMEVIPETHFRFLESCRPYYETDQQFFLHANYDPALPVEQFDAQTLRWLSLRDFVPPKPHRSGKQVWVGHTPQPEVLDLGYLIGIDTGVCKGGWLTAVEVNTRQIWQVDPQGNLRGGVSLRSDLSADDRAT